MQATHPSCCSVLHATPRAGIRLRVGRVGPKSPTMCQAGGVQRNCQLAAAALLSSAALQYTVPLDAAICASATAVRCQVTAELLVKPYALLTQPIVCFRSPSAGHTLAVKRALLEDLLMQEVGSRYMLCCKKLKHCCQCLRLNSLCATVHEYRYIHSGYVLWSL